MFNFGCKNIDWLIQKPSKKEKWKKQDEFKEWWYMRTDFDSLKIDNTLSVWLKTFDLNFDLFSL